MLLLRIALRNLSRRGRKTLVVAVLIAVGVAAFFVGNAVLESSIGGIQSTFADNFTADLSVSARSDQSFSLFGPDIPIIGEYESEPVIVNAADAGARISKMQGVAAVSYVLSSPLLLEAGGARGPGLGLGVIGDEYFALFRAPRFRPWLPSHAGKLRMGSDHGRVGKRDILRTRGIRWPLGRSFSFPCFVIRPSPSVKRPLPA